MGSSRRSRSRRDRLAEDDKDDRDPRRDALHNSIASSGRELDSKRHHNRTRDRDRPKDRRDDGDNSRRRDSFESRHKDTASDSAGRAKDRRSSSPRQRNAHSDRHDSTDADRASNNHKGHRDSMHKRRRSRSPSLDRSRHKKSRSERSRSPFRRESSLDRDQQSTRYNPRSRSNSPASRRRKDRGEDDHYDSDRRRRRSPSKDTNHSDRSHRRSPFPDTHSSSRLRIAQSPPSSRSPSQLGRSARSPRELFPERKAAHATSPRPDRRVASPSKPGPGNSDENRQNRRRSPRPDRELDASPMEGLQRHSHSNRRDDAETRSRRNSPSRNESSRAENGSDPPRKIRRVQDDNNSEEPRPIPSFVSDSERPSQDLSHRRRNDKHGHGSPGRTEPDPYFTPQLNGQQYSAPPQQPRGKRDWQNTEIQYPPGHSLHKHSHNAHPSSANSEPLGPARSGDRRQQGGPQRHPGKGNNQQWSGRGRGGGQFGKRGAWETASDSPYAPKQQTPPPPPPPPPDEHLEDAETLFRPPEAFRVDDESKQERRGSHSNKKATSGFKAEQGTPTSGSKFSFAFKSKNAAPTKNERQRPKENSASLMVDAKRAKPRQEQQHDQRHEPRQEPRQDQRRDHRDERRHEHRHEQRHEQRHGLRQEPRQQRPPPPPPPPLRKPKRLQPKKVLSEEFSASSSVYYRKPGNASVVGSGTYGKVFKAIHVYTKEMVALKKIRMEGERDGFPVTAIREIKLLQSLKHPNIVSLLEVMVEKNDCFMVFEYLSHDLTGILNHPSFRLDLAQKKHFSQQLFEGLSYLHTRGVLHRDIKAANILVSRDGVLKLADFGLARFFAKHHQLDYTNRVITIWYRSPELLLGETQYGPAVDIWSAACVMIEIFTTHAIFPGNGGEINQLDTIYNVLGTPKRSDWPGLVDMAWYELMRPASEKPNIFAEKYRDKLSPEAFNLLESMFHYDPKRRPIAAEVLRHPYFTAEEPLAQPALGLRDLEGDWHEFESKALRRENDKRKAAAASELKREAEQQQRDATQDRKRPVEADEQREAPAHKAVKVA